jgi:hypothetical protein
LRRPDDGWQRTALFHKPPVPFDTANALEQAIAGELRANELPVVVSTNQSLDRANPRVILIPPFAPLPAKPNVGIVHAAADRSQVMVRVRSARIDKAVIRARSGNVETSREVAFANTESDEQTTFLELPDTDDTIEIRVAARNDQLAADNVSWLVRQVSWPRIEAGSGLPAELARMIDVYAGKRYARDDTLVVRVVRSNDLIQNTQSAVIVRTNGGPELAFGVPSQAVVDGEIGRDIDFPAVLQSARIGPEPSAEWKPLVRVGDRTIVAERNSPARQILVNLWSAEFSRRPDFVVLFAQIFDSFAGGPAEWVYDRAFEPPKSWTLLTPPLPNLSPSPGVYRDAGGRLHALNVVDVTIPRVVETDWRRRLEALPGVNVAGRAISPELALAALVLLLAAMVARPRGVATPVVA